MNCSPHLWHVTLDAEPEPLTASASSDIRLLDRLSACMNGDFRGGVVAEFARKDGLK